MISRLSIHVVGGREKLGERIKRVRQARLLGLRELAGKLGISAAYLSRIETCQTPSPPTEKVIRNIAGILLDNFDELMQLAGRVPREVNDYIVSDPDMPAFLRAARDMNASASDLMGMLNRKCDRKSETHPGPDPSLPADTRGHRKPESRKPRSRAQSNLSAQKPT